MKTANQMLKEAQQYAKKGEWDAVDGKVIPTIKEYDQSDVARGLYSLFDDKNGDVRDLAGTIADKLDFRKLDNIERKELKSRLLNGLNDKHIYARFRAALAVVDHRLYSSSKDIHALKEVLGEVAETEEGEVKELALKAIKKIKK